MVSISTRNGGEYPFVLSIDGTLGKESLVVLANLSQIMVVKMIEPILHMRGLINDQVAIAVACSYP